MKQRKRLLAGLIVVVMILSLLPAPVLAESDSVQKRSTTLDLTKKVKYIPKGGGETTVNPNSADITDCAEGWSWNYNDRILTLEGANIQVTQSSIGIELPAGTKIKIASGTKNVISTADSTANSDESYGIHSGGRMVILGDGELDVFSGPANKTSFGICASIYSSIEISENAKVHTYGGPAGLESRGIFVDNGEVIIWGESEVTACGGEVDKLSGTVSCGIEGEEGVLISSGSAVTANGGSEGDKSYGIRVSRRTPNGIVISEDASVQVSGGSAGSGSYGLYSESGVQIDSSDVIATGGAVTERSDTYSNGSCGIFGLNGGISISGDSKVIASGGEAEASGGRSHGLRVFAGNITASGLVMVQANGGSAGYGSGGLYAKNFTASDGAVVAAMGAAAETSTGIEATDSVFICSAKVEARGAQAKDSRGIVSFNKQMSISGNAEVTAVGGLATEKSRGIHVENQSLDISGTSKLIASGGVSEGESSGIFVRHQAFILSGSAIVDTSGDESQSGESYGIFTNKSAQSIIIGGGFATARGHTAAMKKDPDLSGYPSTPVVLGSVNYDSRDSTIVTDPYTNYKYLQIMPEITSVLITPESITVEKGKTQQFDASSTLKDGTVIENNQLVHWSLENAKTSSTAVSESGLLTVAADESAEVLQVTVTSKADPSVSASAVVSVSKSDSSPPRFYSSSHGSSKTSYTITAQAGSGGSISPSGSVQVVKDSDQSFTITPNQGYEVADVLVDGVSVGPVRSWSIKKIQEAHTIKAEFIRSFEDVPADSWYHKAVQNVVSRNVFNGISETKFGPKENMSRAMLVTVLYRLAGEPALTNKETEIPFTDVDSNSWYGTAVSWALQQGIISGISETSFRPNDSITREQLVSMLYRYAEQPASGGDLTGFSDVGNVGAWAEDALRWAVSNGILSGKGSGILDPKGNATRAEVAVIITRFLELK